MKKVFIGVAVLSLMAETTVAAELKFTEGKASVKTSAETFVVFQKPMRIYSASVAQHFKKNKPNLSDNNDLVFVSGLQGVKVQKVYKHSDCTYIIGMGNMKKGLQKIYVQSIHSDGLIEPIAEYAAGNAYKPVIRPSKNGIIIKAFNTKNQKVGKIEFEGCIDLDPGTFPSGR